MLVLNPQITAFLADMGYLVKILSNRYATLRPENLKNIRDFETRVLTLVAYKWK